MPREPKEPVVPMPSDLGESEVPKDAEALTDCINRGVARALKYAVNPKEMTEAVKAATDWYKVRYATQGDDDLGSALTQGRTNGHAG